MRRQRILCCSSCYIRLHNIWYLIRAYASFLPPFQERLREECKKGLINMSGSQWKRQDLSSVWKNLLTLHFQPWMPDLGWTKSKHVLYQSIACLFLHPLGCLPIIGSITATCTMEEHPDNHTSLNVAFLLLRHPSNFQINFVCALERWCLFCQGGSSMLRLLLCGVPFSKHMLELIKSILGSP